MGFVVEKLRVNIKGKQKNCWRTIFFAFVYTFIYYKILEV